MYTSSLKWKREFYLLLRNPRSGIEVERKAPDGAGAQPWADGAFEGGPIPSAGSDGKPAPISESFGAAHHDLNVVPKRVQIADETLLGEAIESAIYEF